MKNIKRVLCLMLISVIAYCFAFSVSAADGSGIAQITFNDSEYAIKVGGTISYTVKLKTEHPITNGEFIINYPQSLLTVDSISFPAFNNKEVFYNYTENVENEIRFNFSKFPQAADFTTEKVLVTVDFRVTRSGAGVISFDKELMSSCDSDNIIHDELPTAIFIELFNLINSQPSSPIQAPSTSITVNAAQTTISVGKTTNLFASVTNGVGATSYSSDNENVATVNLRGVVKGLKAGSANITVKNNYAKATIKINVVDKTIVKKAQKITAKSYTKTYGAKAFSLGAKSSGNGKLIYKSSNKKVAAVNSKGKVTIKGCGKATITIKAKATSKYKAASKKITIIVKPGKIKFTSRNNYYQNGLYKVKQSFEPQKNCDEYELRVSLKRSFSPFVTYNYAKSRKDFVVTSKTHGAKYYIRFRAYKKIGKKTYYGKWSKTTVNI